MAITQSRLSLACVALLAACTLNENPPVTQEVVWDSEETEELARRACYDCHSNETEWKATHSLPFVKGWVEGHVFDGRCRLNFSEWDRPQPLAALSAIVIRGETMPLPSYTDFRPRGRLSDEERELLAVGIEATLALDPPLQGELDDCDANASTLEPIEDPETSDENTGTGDTGDW